ncbi:hypothetical protein N7G274_008732 [Stereocaulon virgatum]|uniref:Uncharacterized protein n=1 Tax=Stereocaulon virgatum TaxID=373712 RepID=A0ABR4A4W2_9LECA
MFRLLEKPEADLTVIRLIGFSNPLNFPWFRTVEICRTSVALAYSQFLFREEASSILPLIYLSSACEAFLEEAVHFSLSPCLLNTVAFSGEEVDNLVQFL